MKVKKFSEGKNDSLNDSDSLQWEHFLSKLNDAMLSHMAYIVLHEHRPFSFIDFLRFEVDNQPYKMAYGTIRNEFSKLVKLDEIELCYKSSRAFYTLKGFNFGKSMTLDHTVVDNNPLYGILKDLPFDKQSIHDIHLKFRVGDLWKMLSDKTKFSVNGRSKDILIPSWTRDNAIVRIIVHKTDTVSVIIGCSSHPIPLNANGIIHFFNLLVRVEEKLQNILDNSSPMAPDIKINAIPEYKSWLVTMWHFGRDSLVELTDNKFCISVENAQHILTRLYVKSFNGKKKIRIEKQEYPKKTVLDAIEGKLASLS